MKSQVLLKRNELDVDGSKDPVLGFSDPALSSRSFFFLAVVLTLFGLQQNLLATPRSCTVNGHGPYDGDLKDCLQLAKDQALTDCKLESKSSTAKYVFRGDEKTLAAGKCTSKFSKPESTCAAPACLANKTN